MVLDGIPITPKRNIFCSRSSMISHSSRISMPGVRAHLKNRWAISLSLPTIEWKHLFRSKFSPPFRSVDFSRSITVGRMGLEVPKYKTRERGREGERRNVWLSDLFGLIRVKIFSGVSRLNFFRREFSNVKRVRGKMLFVHEMDFSKRN